MKEQLIILAKEKGFVSNIIGKSVEVEYSKKDFYYLWLCELQKWLRIEKKINVIIYPELQGYSGSCVFYRYDIHMIRPGLINKYGDNLGTFRHTLEVGLQYALKQI